MWNNYLGLIKFSNWNYNQAIWANKIYENKWNAAHEYIRMSLSDIET